MSACETVNDALREEYPDARCELYHSGPFELLVATVLSAQSTDRRVNTVTPALFLDYPTPAALAAAPEADVADHIRPTGLHRTKAKNLVAMSRMILERHGGRVPSGMQELTALPGVGRKTALVVRANAFGLPGLAVDTHVSRLARRLSLSEAKTPRGIERDLCRALPEEEWTGFSHRMIAHGRAVCHARRPDCGRCCLRELCPAAEEV